LAGFHWGFLFARRCNSLNPKSKIQNLKWFSLCLSPAVRYNVSVNYKTSFSQASEEIKVIKFRCGSCDYTEDIDDKYAGKKTLCPKCSAPNLVPNQQSLQPQKPGDLIKVYCPLCNKKIGVPAEYAGRRVKCPGCKNPVAIPPSSQQDKPAESQIDIAQAGGLTQQPPDGLFADAQDLLSMEKQAKAVDMPELTKLPASAETGNAPAADTGEFARLETKKRDEKRFNLDLPIGQLIAITVIIVAVGLLFNWRLGSAEDKPPAPKEQISIAEEFAAKFLGLLAKGEVNDASLMLAEELRNEDTDKKLRSLASGPLGKVWNDSNNAAVKLSAQKEEGNVYIFGYYLQTQEPESVFVVVAQYPNGFKVEGINYHHSAGSEPLSVESGRYAQISKTLSESFVGKVLGILKKSLFVTVILFTASRLSKAIVFYRAGESAWAAIVPCWHEWTLAELGDKSGIWGLAAFLLAGVPVLGQIIYFSLLLYFSLGIAHTHGRGVLFGIGLCFLPCVFFPIMVFSQD